jgi:small conductance mechanosensitive channel
VEWFVSRPLKVFFIFFLAWLLVRILRRGIDSMIAKLIRQREERAEARRREEAAEDRFGSITRSMKKAQMIAQQSERSQQRAQALGAVLRSAAAIIVYGTSTFIALAEFDINLAPLIASAGIAGAALGFGAQSLVKDFLSGIFMLVEDQYGIGDIVDLGDASGTVEEIHLRMTRVRDVHGTVWFVPNGEIRRVANKSQLWARTVLDVEVAYDTDLAHAAAVIKRVADSVWQDRLPQATVLEEPEIWGVEMFGASSISIRVAFKVEPNEQWAVSREVRKRLKTAFDEEGIQIPFPQRTVWMHEVTEEPKKAKAAQHTDELSNEEFRGKGAKEGG